MDRLRGRCLRVVGTPVVTRRGGTLFPGTSSPEPGLLSGTRHVILRPFLRSHDISSLRNVFLRSGVVPIFETFAVSIGPHKPEP